ncbi:MAG: helix-turn-helix domain-containing protein [Microlunatus sp.]
MSTDTSDVSFSEPATRTYVSELRQEQAAATRERVIQAAAELFAEKGYAGTTMPAIARRARVSTETVQNHGPKVQLLRAAIAAVSFGGTPGAPVADTELGRQLVADVDTPEAAARAGAEVIATVNQGSHGVWMAFSEASRSDPRLADELRTLTEEIAVQTGLTLQDWERRGWLRTDLSREALVQRTTMMASVELWDRVVRAEGRSRAEYVELLAGMLLDLLADPAARGIGTFDPSARVC